jgi:hypothetical protein
MISMKIHLGNKPKLHRNKMAGNANTVPDRGGSQSAIDNTAAATKKIADTSADLARVHAETTKESVLAGMKIAVGASDRSAKHFEEALAGDEATNAMKQSLQHVEALSGARIVLAHGFQEIAREWMNWTKSGVERSNGAITAVMECRSPQAFFEVQSRFMKENLAGLMATIQKVSEISTDTSKMATQKITDNQSANT